MHSHFRVHCVRQSRSCCFNIFKWKCSSFRWILYCFHAISKHRTSFISFVLRIVGEVMFASRMFGDWRCFDSFVTPLEYLSFESGVTFFGSTVSAFNAGILFLHRIARSEWRYFTESFFPLSVKNSFHLHPFFLRNATGRCFSFQKCFKPINNHSKIIFLEFIFSWHLYQKSLSHEQLRREKEQILLRKWALLHKLIFFLEMDKVSFIHQHLTNKEMYVAYFGKFNSSIEIFLRKSFANISKHWLTV